MPGPRNHPKERDDKIEDETKENLVTAMSDGTCKAQRAAARQFGIGLSSVNRILKEANMTAYKNKLQILLDKIKTSLNALMLVMKQWETIMAQYILTMATTMQEIINIE